MGEGFTLGCPICKSELISPYFYPETKNYCPVCIMDYKTFSGAMNLIPSELFSTAHMIESRRYDEIAREGPLHYTGLDATYPKRRVEYILDTLMSHGVSGFVDIGPGFGHLERATLDFERCAVDLCHGFLVDIKKEMPEVTCVRGLAEHLPFVSGSVSCLVADSTFQSVIDREQFLYEIARVTGVDSLLILSIAYKWNYPRRPQNGFNIDRADELEVFEAFIAELGFDAKFIFYDTPGTREVQYRSQGDYLWIVGRKTR